MVHSRVSMARPERYNRKAMALDTHEVKRIMIDVEKNALMWWQRRASVSGNDVAPEMAIESHVALPPKPKHSIKRTICFVISKMTIKLLLSLLNTMQLGRTTYSLLQAQVKLEIRVSYERVCFKACVAEPGACLRYLHGNFA